MHGEAMTDRARPTDGPGPRLALRAFQEHPYAQLVLDRDGALLARNRAASALLGELAAELEAAGPSEVARLLEPGNGSGNGNGTGTGHGVTASLLIARALATDGPLPEVRTDLPPGCAAEAAWITVARLGGGDEGLLVELRPGRRDDRRRRTEPHWTEGPKVRIHALGRTRVESHEASLGGRWLENRTGRLLKFLVAERHRAVHADVIAEHLWPASGAAGIQSVRYFVHALRARLEPDRVPRSESPFVRFADGAYMLDRTRVVVDADELEAAVKAGRGALARGDAPAARTQLLWATALYEGEFLADEPYAEWARAERDRLHALVSDALRVLAALTRAEGDLDATSAHLVRLGELEPYDVDIHREIIALCRSRGRRSEALRRYTALRQRMLATFGEELDFTLADLAGA
jgi:DNA-binding SARP family transcriptional activator